MKLTDLFEYGKVVPGVNMPYYMTKDEIKKQAKKFGFDLDDNNVPPSYKKYKDDVRINPTANMNSGGEFYAKDGLPKK